MGHFKVTEVTEIRTTYYIEAKSAPTAIREVKNGSRNNSDHQSFEQHFVASEIKEEDEQ